MTMLHGYNVSDAEKKAAQDEMDTLMLAVSSDLTSISTASNEQAIKILIDIQKRILPIQLKELANPSYNLYRTRVLEKCVASINSMVGHAIKLREFELKEDIDVMNNPKIKLMFNWFIEVIDETIGESRLSDNIDHNKKEFYNVFVSKLQNWEEKVEKRLKKLSFTDILNSKNLLNPLTKHEE
jgi:hypothetical protein